MVEGAQSSGEKDRITRKFLELRQGWSGLWRQVTMSDTEPLIPGREIAARFKDSGVRNRKLNRKPSPRRAVAQRNPQASRARVRKGRACRIPISTVSPVQSSPGGSG